MCAKEISETSCLIMKLALTIKEGNDRDARKEGKSPTVRATGLTCIILNTLAVTDEGPRKNAKVGF